VFHSIKMGLWTRPAAVAIPTFAALMSLPAHSSVIYTSRNSSVSTVVCDSNGANCSPQRITDTAFDSFSQSLGVQNSTGYSQQQSQLSQTGISVSLQTKVSGTGWTC
jgi:hypothetical protein